METIYEYPLLTTWYLFQIGFWVTVALTAAASQHKPGIKDDD